MTELVCFGKSCYEWKDPNFQARLPMPSNLWRQQLQIPMINGSAVCDPRFGVHLRCTDLASGSPCHEPDMQRCSDLPEMRGPLQLNQQQVYKGSVLMLDKSWTPTKLPHWKNSTRVPCHSSGCLKANDIQPPNGDWITKRLTFLESSEASGQTAWRQNYVPMLQQEVHAHGPWPRISQLPCSSARMEDAVILRSFFVDHSGRPVDGIGVNATFVEMGAFDGLRESESLFFERCLGWRGILIEAHPLSFQKLLSVRDASLNG